MLTLTAIFWAFRYFISYLRNYVNFAGFYENYIIDSISCCSGILF